MFRKLFKILSLVMLLVMSVTCVAIADVPDPYGRPGRRPRPMPEPVNAYWVQREGHSYSEDKASVELFYRALNYTEIRYKLTDEQGNIVKEGTDICKEGFGTILLEMAKPENGKALEYSYESSCYQTAINTSFGLKKLEEPKLKGTWNCSFIVKADNNGEIIIDRVKDSYN